MNKNIEKENTEIKKLDTAYLPGIKPVLELLTTDAQKVDAVFLRKGRKDEQTDEIIDLCRKHNIRFSLVDVKALERLYKGNSQGVIARLAELRFVDFADLLQEAPEAPLPLIVVLDQVLDPGNAGTLIRTLYALGGAGLILPKHQGAFLGAAASRVAAGAMQRLPICRVTNLAQALDEAKRLGYSIYGADVELGAVSVYDFKPDFPAVLVLGSEESGIRLGIKKRCDQMLEIPMKRDFDSLNVAQAGAIMLGFFSAKL